MATQLSAIYEALADVDVTLDGEVVAVLKPSAMSNRVNSVDLPLRVISPMARDGRGSLMGFPFASNGRGTATWRLNDLLLVATVNEGQGLRQYSAELITAIEAYVNAVTADVQLMRGVRIANITADAGIYTYIDRDYFAVEFGLEITEVLQ